MKRQEAQVRSTTCEFKEENAKDTYKDFLKNVLGSKCLFLVKV
jgi:hypothetical protein